MSPVWRIYYDDGSTFDSDQGAPGDAPAWGVLVILIADPEVGHMSLHGFDFYIFREMWLGVDRWGLTDYLFNVRPLMEGLVVGRTVPPAHFQETLKRAEDDPDFPPKSAYRPTIERKP
jgi:hypothetical protein